MFNQYVTITFGGQVFAQPQCGTCGQPPSTRTAEGQLWCEPCLALENQRRAIATADNWIAAAFFAVAPDQRSRVYRQLAALFHPDTGGDPQLIIALNRVRDRFR